MPLNTRQMSWSHTTWKTPLTTITAAPTLAGFVTSLQQCPKLHRSCFDDRHAWAFDLQESRSYQRVATNPVLSHTRRLFKYEVNSEFEHYLYHNKELFVQILGLWKYPRCISVILVISRKRKYHKLTRAFRNYIEGLTALRWCPQALAPARPNDL